MFCTRCVHLLNLMRKILDVSSAVGIPFLSELFSKASVLQIVSVQ